MRLAVRLFLAFGVLGATTPLLLGHRLREERRADEVARFHKDLAAACDAIAGELGREAERDARLLQNACSSPDLAEKLQANEVLGASPGRDSEALGAGASPGRGTEAAESGARVRTMRGHLGPYVSATRLAFDLDELVLLHANGDPIAADPRVLYTHSPHVFAKEMQGAPRATSTSRTAFSDPALRRAETNTDLRAALTFRDRSALESDDTSGRLSAELVRCRIPRATAPRISLPKGAQAREPEDITLLGARNLLPPAERLAKPFGVAVSFGTAAPADPPGTVRSVCALPLGDATVSLAVTKSESGLLAALASGDRTVYGASGFAAAAAVLLALLVARSLGKPLAQLAEEAWKVADETAQPLGVRGSGEIAELAQAFDRMLEDLAATRRKLAAASRVAAWREVARRVAHEIKNPLMPIRAAVETLRRLRARDDPRFDEYFDEASRTVLDEVQRITTIVGEFTRFARLPPPQPVVVDPREVLAHVVALHNDRSPLRVGPADSPQDPDAPPRRVPVVAVIEGDPPTIFADRDQVIQVLVNLVQNAQDAVAEAFSVGAPTSTSLGTAPSDSGARAGVVTVRISGRSAAPKSRMARSVRASETIDQAPQTRRRDKHSFGASDDPFDGVVFEVEDDGNGVPDAFVDRLFEPYATTKSHGTGLGLAIAARIAVEHDGDLSYRRSPRGGACFRLVLPCSGPPSVGPSSS